MTFRIHSLYRAAWEHAGRVGPSGQVLHHPDSSDICRTIAVFSVAAGETHHVRPDQQLVISPLSGGGHVIADGKLQLLVAGMCYQFNARTWVSIVNAGRTPLAVGVVEHVDVYGTLLDTFL
jgi:hypothetical protein